MTDGFTGNVVPQDLREPGRDDRRHDQGGADARRPVEGGRGARRCAAFARFRKRGSTTRRWAGAPLLGINGAAIICHGASPVKAIKNAVRVARGVGRKPDVNEHIKTALEAEVVLAEGREGGRE